MGIIKVFNGSLNNVLADQWKDIITAGQFDELDILKPGVGKSNSMNKSWNSNGTTTGIITKGSVIYVPENTAAIIYNQSSIENVIYQPGGYQYNDGEDTVFSSSDAVGTIFNQVKERIKYAGTSVDDKRVSYMNLREIRGIKFGTKGPLSYHDNYYDADMEIYAYGTFSIKITEPIIFVKNFLPANKQYYNAKDSNMRREIIPELLQSFCCAVNNMSKEFRISQLPSQNIQLAKLIEKDDYNAGSWEERFGFKIVKIAIENIELSDRSRELINMFSEKKLSVRAYENISQQAANISAQQNISQGIKDKGFGESGMGMIVGMNAASNVSNILSGNNNYNIDDQINMLKKLKELLDAGILTEEEFNQKKKEILMV